MWLYIVKLTKLSHRLFWKIIFICLKQPKLKCITSFTAVVATCLKHQEVSTLSPDEINGLNRCLTGTGDISTSMTPKWFLFGITVSVQVDNIPFQKAHMLYTLSRLCMDSARVWLSAETCLVWLVFQYNDMHSQRKLYMRMSISTHIIIQNNQLPSNYIWWTNSGNWRSNSWSRAWQWHTNLFLEMNKHFNESGGSDTLVCWINTDIMMHTFTIPMYKTTRV